VKTLMVEDIKNLRKVMMTYPMILRKNGLEKRQSMKRKWYICRLKSQLNTEP
jgi:hypothetical protein